MHIEHQITITNHGEYRRWYYGFDPIMGEKAKGVHTISYPRVTEYSLARLLLGTPDEIQLILTSFSHV